MGIDTLGVSLPFTHTHSTAFSETPQLDIHCWMVVIAAYILAAISAYYKVCKDEIALVDKEAEGVACREGWFPW